MTQYVRASTDSSQNLLNTVEHCHDEYILGMYQVQNYLVSSRANWQASDLIGSFHIPERSSHPYFSARERNTAGHETTYVQLCART